MSELAGTWTDGTYTLEVNERRTPQGGPASEATFFYRFRLTDASGDPNLATGFVEGGKLIFERGSTAKAQHIDRARQLYAEAVTPEPADDDE